jgi:hypothetical protein
VDVRDLLARRQLFQGVQLDMEAALDRLEPFADFGPTRVGANVAHAVARTNWTIPFTSLCGFRTVGDTLDSAFGVRPLEA